MLPALFRTRRFSGFLNRAPWTNSAKLSLMLACPHRSPDRYSYGQRGWGLGLGQGAPDPTLPSGGRSLPQAQQPAPGSSPPTARRPALAAGAPFSSRAPGPTTTRSAGRHSAWGLGRRTARAGRWAVGDAGPIRCSCPLPLPQPDRPHPPSPPLPPQRASRRRCPTTCTAAPRRCCWWRTAATRCGCTAPTATPRCASWRRPTAAAPSRACASSGPGPRRPRAAAAAAAARSPRRPPPPTWARAQGLLRLLLLRRLLLRRRRPPSSGRRTRPQPACWRSARRTGRRASWPGRWTGTRGAPAR
jgi:hypothetical protein